MSSKKITTVIGTLIVILFCYISYRDTVITLQNLQKQQDQIKNLNIQYEKTNQDLDKTVELKSSSKTEIQKLQEEKEKLNAERQKLEYELTSGGDK